jgi:hypothetical protein
MRNWLVALGLAACLGMFAFGSANAPSTSNSNPRTDDDLRKLEQTWLDAAAVPDLPELRRIFADDFMGTSFGGGVLSKTDVIPPDGSTATHMPKSMLKDSTVRVYGDTAVLMGEVEMQVPQKPETIRVTTVFQKRGEAWQIIAVHMSHSPAEQPQ